MPNPWLKIPAADYEGHMDSPHVGQLSFLARTFDEAMRDYDPGAIALLGCATGNGLECVKADATRRVTAVDFNPAYLKILRQRHEGRIEGLEVIQADLATCVLEDSAYSLIFAGLVFEYLDPGKLILSIARWLQAGGVMAAVLQLPAKHGGKVSQTPYTRLNLLDPIMKLVSPEELKATAKNAGLQEIQARTVTLESGKAFFIGSYRKV